MLKNSSKTAPPICKVRLREINAKIARNYNKHSALPCEIRKRLDDRLDMIRYDPTYILDAGCATGESINKLFSRYPKTNVFALDFCLNMLNQTQSYTATNRLFRICADIEKLPISDSTIDLYWSNLSLQYVEDLRCTFLEANRVMTKGGLIIFSIFGPDTFKEFRSILSEVNNNENLGIEQYIDMHDIGDLLIKTGFVDPVIESEMIELSYSHIEQGLEELKNIGSEHIVRDMKKFIGSDWEQVLSSYHERFSANSTNNLITYEIIYGHAWVPEKEALDSAKEILFFAPGKTY